MSRRAIACAAAALALAAPLAAGAAEPDWSRVADVPTIRIRTTRPDGSTRERTIWLLVHEGPGYVRAGGLSRWDSNVDAAPDVSVRIGDAWYDLRATRIPKGPLYDAVMAGMRAKYGGSDALVGPLRAIGGGPRILRPDSGAGATP